MLDSTRRTGTIGVVSEFLPSRFPAAVAPPPRPASPARPVVVILPGVTADRRKLARCQALLRASWPEADIRVADYLSRWRGVAASGRWLERWGQEVLAPGVPVFVVAYILGGAVLAFAPTFVSRAQRVVILRSRYQEAVPRELRRWCTAPGVALLFGKHVADLGVRGYWPPGFRLPGPHLILVETKRSRLATRLAVSPLSDEELGLSDYKEIDIDHDAAYESAQLIETAAVWLRPPHV